MKEVELKISPLIARQFPAFFQDEGPDFVAFVQAYYEWLEQNGQLLELENTDNFYDGDTVTQGATTGTIVTTSGVGTNNILVLVNGLDTFKCFNVCAELTPITSSSGGTSLIKRGGTTRRLGSIFFSRSLPQLRDIDRTIDLFIVKFKEKFLKNIEFDVATNKKLLVKNSLDLYRSKGTERSIDLFFRLIYGVKASVYYPGDDLFRLSDAEWFKPQYIEINSTSVDRAITLVGKQVTGATSGATAFVERYVTKRTGLGFVHTFYVSSVNGTFDVNEVLKANNQVFSDSPRIVGSFTAASVDDGSDSFRVGDIVDFNSDTGLGGKGRVTRTVKGSGEVSFKLLNSGWGYSTYGNNVMTEYSTNTFVSDKILTLTSVRVGEYVNEMEVISAGSGYSNTDRITVTSRSVNAAARPITNSSGSITSIVLTRRGSGFYPQEDGTVITISNTSNMPSTGVNADFTVRYKYPGQYFKYLETISQPYFSANGRIIWTSPDAILRLDIPTGNFAIGDYVYQVDENNEIVAEAVVTRVSQLTIAGGYITTSNTNGVFRLNQNLLVKGKEAQAALADVTLSVGVMMTSSNNFSDSSLSDIITLPTSTQGQVLGITSGAGAEYGILSLSDSETFYVNTDVLNNPTLLETRLNANSYNLPANPAANSSSVILGALRRIPMTLGTIKNFTRINPGAGYNKDPIASPYQRYITGYQAYDYVFDLKDVSGGFVQGEYILHTAYSNTAWIEVSNTVPYRLGERVFAANTSTNYIANGTISYIDNVANTIILSNLDGTFPGTNNYIIKSFITPAANAYIANTQFKVETAQAKGIVKSYSQNKLYVKRIQIDNLFEVGNTVVGSLSGSTANVVAIGYDVSAPVAGLNAKVNAKATTADGVVSAIEVVDSGFGFSNDDKITFSSTTGELRTGTVDNIRGGVGIGSGYYRTARGIASGLSKIHDGDYYQEYSYDIISRIPLDRYGEMFKKVMHTAGTRFFGSVLMDSTANTTIGAAPTSVGVNTSIVITDDSPYVIQDRAAINVEDRSSIFIETREQ